MGKIKLRLQQKFTIAFIILGLFMTVTLSLVTSTMRRDTLEARYSNSAYNISHSIASVIKGEEVIKYLETRTKDARYEQINGYLEEAMKLENVKYIYIIRCTDEGTYYVWSADSQGAKKDALGRFEQYIGSRDAINDIINNGGSYEKAIITDSADYGYISSLYAPIYDSNGETIALVGVDMSLDQINSTIYHQVVILALIIAGIISLFIIAFILYFRSKLILPIKMITNEVSTYVKKGEGLEFDPINVKTGDELQILADSFNKMAVDMDEYIKNLTEVTAEKERIHGELNVARNIQASMLPCIFPPFPSRNDLDIYATMNPAKEVGGDFYDFFLIDDDHLALVIADVSGKGVSAALFMVIAKTLIKNQFQNGNPTDKVLETVNNQLCENNSENMFVTAFVAVFNIKTGELTFSNAGHNKPLIYRRNEDKFDWLDMNSAFILAGFENVKYKAEKTYLDKGDMLYLYTDGVTEAMNPNNALFSEDRLKDVLNKPDYNNLDLKDTLGYIKGQIDVFVDGADQADDITMMIFKNKSIDYKGEEKG